MNITRFRKSLTSADSFTVTWELVPGRGAIEKSQDEIFATAEKAAEGGKIDSLTIADGPGGNPAISAPFIGIELKRMGIDPLVHFTCKDRNRSQIESQLYAFERAGVSDLLIMTGDYPVSGFQGRPRPVFDLDAVHVLQLIEELNAGLELPGKNSVSRLSPTHFFAGAAVSPFKQTEAELMIQYYKLVKKIAAGAKFIITQLGFDARKFHELIQFVSSLEVDIPVIGNIYLPNRTVARLMAENKLPGCIVTPSLLSAIEKEWELPDKGRSARILRAAKMFAMLKGMGYHGVHIGGHGIKYEDVEEIIERGHALSPEWMNFVAEFDYPMNGGFYYYTRDVKTGLNTSTPSLKGKKGGKPLQNRLFRLAHHMMFEPGAPFHKPSKALARAIDGKWMEKPFTFGEHMMKTAVANCMHCGDCALFDIANLCPMSQCPKNQRNGACGGSYEGWCEVHPGKKRCIYYLAYERLKAYNEEEGLKEYIIPPVNWDLHHRSSWVTYFTGRDHSSRKKKVELRKRSAD